MTWTNCTAFGPRWTGCGRHLGHLSHRSHGRRCDAGRDPNISFTIVIVIVCGMCTMHVTGTPAGEFHNPTSTTGSQLVLTGGSTLTVAKTGLRIDYGSTGALTGSFDVTGSPSDPITMDAGPYTPPPPAIIASGGASSAATAGLVRLISGVWMDCTSAAASLTVNAGAYTVPATIGTITDSTWTGCTGLGFTARVAQNSPWQIWVIGAPNAGGVTPVEVRDVEATMSIGGGVCTLTITGTASGYFSNDTQRLALTGGDTLDIAKSGLCIGVEPTAAFTASYVVEAASDIAIS